MGSKTKLLYILLSLGLSPILILGTIIYLYYTNSLEAIIRSELDQDVARSVYNIETDLIKREKYLVGFARNDALRKFLLETGQNFDRKTGEASHSLSNIIDQEIPETLKANIESLFTYQPYITSITCFISKDRPIFHVEETGIQQKGIPTIKFTEILPPDIYVDENVWTKREKDLFSSPAIVNTTGARLIYSVPVLDKDGGQVYGALLVDLRLSKIIEDHMMVESERTALRSAFILDRTGRIAFHTNDALKYQLASNVMPYFKSTLDQMAGNGNSSYYGPDGTRWLVSYQLIKKLNLSMAIAVSDRSIKSSSRFILTSLIMSALVFAIICVLLFRYKTRLVQAQEDLKVNSSSYKDKMFSGIKASSQDADEREIEARQFELFMRLSAMFAYDIKKVIDSLTGLVDQTSDKSEVASIKGTINELQCIVSKLSEPQKTISGEHSCPTDLIPIIKQVVEHVTSSTNGKYKLEILMPESLVANVDGEKIRKVVESIFNNAIEAIGARRDGWIRVEAGRVNEETIFFSITDSGPGISEEFQRKKLFRPFVSTKSRGLGLGLYTCQEIVKFYHGHLEVESSLSKGTCFRVILPSKDIKA